MTERQARYHRSRTIKSLANKGYSLRAIADLVGVHHKTVWRSLRGLNH